MTLRRDHLVLRVLGIALGLGFLGLGGFAILGDPQLADGAGHRALGLGLTLVVAGVAAVVGSLIVADPSRIW